jgi:hypothetical protein
MRKLIWATLLLAAAWAGWWLVGSTAKERALLAWLAERRAAGWIAETESLNVRGFPSRFDTRITGLELADPGASWAWSAPEFEILALSYRPNRFIAVWPHSQVWSGPSGSVRITSEDMRGSVAFVPSTALALDSLTVDIRDLALQGSGWSAALDSALFATRRAMDEPPEEHAHDLALTIRNLEMPPFWKAVVNRAGNLPDVFSDAALEVTLRYDRDWDRLAVEEGAPLLQSFRLDKLRLVWGDLQLDVLGDVTIDARGFFEGELQLRAKNWQDILQVFEDAGSLTPEMAGLLRQGLGVLAMLSGDPRTLNAPLAFHDGEASLGPIPIGPAPRLIR